MKCSKKVTKFARRIDFRRVNFNRNEQIIQIIFIDQFNQLVSNYRQLESEVEKCDATIANLKKTVASFKSTLAS